MDAYIGVSLYPADCFCGPLCKCIPVIAREPAVSVRARAAMEARASVGTAASVTRAAVQRDPPFSQTGYVQLGTQTFYSSCM